MGLRDRDSQTLAFKIEGQLFACKKEFAGDEIFVLKKKTKSEKKISTSITYIMIKLMTASENYKAA